MKHLILLGLLATSLMAFADDASVLKNGDFSAGLSEWEGDVHTAGSASDDSGATSGVVVKLRDEWTTAKQDFTGKAGIYGLTIKYTVTPDFSLSRRAEDYANVPSQLGLTLLAPFNAAPGKWLVIINDLSVRKFMYWQIQPSTSATGEQTVHLRVRLSDNGDAEKGFFLCFPPGKGTINLLSISLDPLAGAQ